MKPIQITKSIKVIPHYVLLTREELAGLLFDTLIEYVRGGVGRAASAAVMDALCEAEEMSHNRTEKMGEKK